MKRTHLAAATQAQQFLVPAIRSPWPSLAGSKYAGISGAHEGHADAHLVLIAHSPKKLPWKEQKAWAESVGGRLPTPEEGHLLIANLRGEFKPEWYWLLKESQSSSGHAWGQYFDDGTQYTLSKSFVGWGCAVRRFDTSILQSFDSGLDAPTSKELLQGILNAAKLLRRALLGEA